MTYFTSVPPLSVALAITSTYGLHKLIAWWSYRNRR